jgi:uncharacterized protein (TIGR04222 family)
MNPLDWEGPAFLALYLVLLPAAIAAAVVLRWLLRLPADEPPAEAFDLPPYAIAYLTGRERLAVDTAIVRLLHRGALAVDAATGKLSQRGDRPAGGPELERVVYAAAGSENSKHINEVHTAAAPVAGQPREQLEGLGLLLSDSAATRIRLASAGVVCLAFVLGLVKVFVGVARGRPVGFLIVLLVVTAIVAIVFLVKRPFRTRRGDGLLRRLRDDNAALEYAAGRRVAGLSDDDLVLSLGLFGLGVLAVGPLSATYTSLMNAQRRAAAHPWSSSSSSCGSSCGSGCGGGGGGGCGGGCGGGGCGGCGG